MMQARGEPSLSSRKSNAALPVETRLEGAEDGFRGELNAQREADRVIANQFAPPGVLINAALQILQFRGATAAYLEPPKGKATFEVLKMAREGLMLPLRATINKAKKENKTVRRENVRVNENGSTRLINLEVVPLKNLRERCFLVLFQEAERSDQYVAAEPPVKPPGGAKGERSAAVEALRRVAELEAERVVCKNTIVGDWLSGIPSALQMVLPNRPHQRRFP